MKENQIFRPNEPYKWARRVSRGEPYYEVSSKGDKRFSAFYAKLSDGRSIEEAYQLDIKGYRKLGNNPMLGKGKPPMIPTNDLPKITSHYFELKGDKFNIFKNLVDLTNCCSKLICSDSRDKSIRDFIRIVKSEHGDKVNQTDYDIEDIVLVLIDDSTKDTSEELYNKAVNSLYAAGSVGVQSFVTITRSTMLFINPIDQLSKFISPRYQEIPGTGYFINLYEQYRNLWAQWALENLDKLSDLAVKASGRTITDMFATTDISQAHALCDILNKYYKLK